jgi:hypothetical protein
MKTLLLTHQLKKWGWVLFIPSFIAGIVFQIMDDQLLFQPKIKVFGFFGKSFLNNNQLQLFRMGEIDLIPNLIGICFLIGGMLIMFTKEKQEDEFINQLRLNALQFAVLINYALLFICFITIHGLGFLDVMVYNMFTVIIIYIIRFKYLLFNNSIIRNEEQH